MKFLARIFCVLIFTSVLFSGCRKSTDVAVKDSAAPDGFNHQTFSNLLSKHVTDDGMVDYAGLKNDREKLDGYLNSLTAAKVNAMPNDAEKLAFWINGYNAFVLASVLDEVKGNVKSVHDIDKLFFKEKKHQIAGEELTLDEIEKRGRDLGDPRIHFAVNCASASCPKLRRSAYDAASLDRSLSKAAVDFLGDQGRGMQFDLTKNEISLSPIFKWYAGDFTKSDATIARAKAELSGAEVFEVAKQYLPADVRQDLNERKLTLKWMEYDWTLNSMENFKAPGAPKRNQ